MRPAILLVRFLQKEQPVLMDVQLGHAQPVDLCETFSWCCEDLLGAPEGFYGTILCGRNRWRRRALGARTAAGRTR